VQQSNEQDVTNLQATTSTTALSSIQPMSETRSITQSSLNETGS